MSILKILGVALVVIIFGFYSFQKGREYERGQISIAKEKLKENKMGKK